MKRFIAPLFVLLWSSGFIGARFGLPHAPPLYFLSLRYLLVIALLLPLAWLARAPWPREPRRIAHIAFSGVLVQALYLGGVFSAIKAGLPAGITALVVGLQPLLTALGAALLLGEGVLRRQWAGLALGLLGVALVVADKGQHSFPPSALLPALLALLGITAGTLWQKRFAGNFDLRSGTAIQFIASLLVTAPLAYLWEAPVLNWAPEFIFALAWLVLVLSLGAIALLNLLLREGSAVNVARLFYLTPALTALLAWALFGENLGLIGVGGMALAAAGVYLARSG